jgi:hypothetical protein
MPLIPPIPKALRRPELTTGISWTAFHLVFVLGVSLLLNVVLLTRLLAR